MLKAAVHNRQAQRRSAGWSQSAVRSPRSAFLHTVSWFNLCCLLDGILSCVMKRLASGGCSLCSVVFDYQYLA